LSTNKIIVLGGSGFLGSNIIKSLQKMGFENVTCGDVNYNKTINCKYLQLNLLDINSLYKVLNKFDTIINCIGQITNPFNLCLKLNTLGINNLVKVVLETNAYLIQISTVSVYGSAMNCDEESPLNPETNYAAIKASAEQILLANLIKQRLTIYRISNLYGSNQNKGIISYLIKSYQSDKKLFINNNGELVRSFIHVEDCSNIISQILFNKQIHGIYNIKGDETYTIIELIKKFENYFNTSFDVTYNNVDPWENIINLDGHKLSSLCNYNHKWQLFNFIKQEINNIDEKIYN